MQTSWWIFAGELPLSIPSITRPQRVPEGTRLLDFQMTNRTLIGNFYYSTEQSSRNNLHIFAEILKRTHLCDTLLVTMLLKLDQFSSLNVNMSIVNFGRKIIKLIYAIQLRRGGRLRPRECFIICHFKIQVLNRLIFGWDI